MKHVVNLSLNLLCVYLCVCGFSIYSVHYTLWV